MYLYKILKSRIKRLYLKYEIKVLNLYGGERISLVGGRDFDSKDGIEDNVYYDGLLVFYCILYIKLYKK